MSTLGVDVSHYQLPGLPWAAWVAGGLRCAVVQMTHGEDDEPHGEEHLINALAAGVPHVGIYHFLLHGNVEQQLLGFISWVGYHGVTFAALDIESPAVTAQDIGLFCGYWEDRGVDLPLYLYGNSPLVVAAAKQFNFPVWWASYPLDTARISAPPPGSKPSAPAGMNVAGWQFTGTGLLLPYAGDIDLTTWYEIPGVPMPTTPAAVVPHGFLSTFHANTPGQTVPTMRESALAGHPYPSVVVLNDGGVAVDLRLGQPAQGQAPASPTTYTILRYYNPADDSMQGIDDWTDAQQQAWVDRVLNKIYSNISDEQARANDWVIAWNEADPPGPFGWQKMGQTYLKLIDSNEARRAAGQRYVKLCLGGTAQGTPEWAEMLQLADTGLFARMQAVGYAWSAHEGVFRGQSIDNGYGASIPEAPTVPGSGSACFRFVYLFEGILRPRGQLVPLIIGEWYDGGTVGADIPTRLEAWKWYDTRLYVYEYALGFAGFTAWPTPDWKISDLSDIYLSDQHKQLQNDLRQRANGADMPNVSDSDYAALVATNLTQAATLSKYRTPFKAGDVALAVADPLVTFLAPKGQPKDARYAVTYDLDVQAVSADGLWLEVAPSLWCLASSVRHK